MDGKICYFRKKKYGEKSVARTRVPKKPHRPTRSFIKRKACMLSDLFVPRAAVGLAILRLGQKKGGIDRNSQQSYGANCLTDGKRGPTVVERYRMRKP